jgi:outer membrane protein TolC
LLCGDEEVRVGGELDQDRPRAKRGRVRDATGITSSNQRKHHPLPGLHNCLCISPCRRADPAASPSSAAEPDKRRGRSFRAGEQSGLAHGADAAWPRRVTNYVYQEHYITLELEVRGQGKHRKAVAEASVSRVEWEICQQELLVSIAVIRAYNTVLYRSRKLEIFDELLRINEAGVRRLSEAKVGKPKATDLLLARIDLDAQRAQRGQAQTAVTVARSELRRLLGTLDDFFIVSGDPDVWMPQTDPNALTQLALEQRPDLKARRAALSEAEASERLVVANRFGNPAVGPYYEYDPTRISYIGFRLGFPLPILNTRRGEIMGAKATVARVQSEVQQLEQQVSQDVQAALGRLSAATRWANEYAGDVLPALTSAKQDLEKKFANNDAEVSLANVLAVQRGHLKAVDTLLDARFEVSQAEADLAFATAEPALAVGPRPATMKAESVPVGR